MDRKIKIIQTLLLLFFFLNNLISVKTKIIDVSDQKFSTYNKYQLGSNDPVCDFKFEFLSPIASGLKFTSFYNTTGEPNIRNDSFIIFTVKLWNFPIGNFTGEVDNGEDILTINFNCLAIDFNNMKFRVYPNLRSNRFTDDGCAILIIDGLNGPLNGLQDPHAERAFSPISYNSFKIIIEPFYTGGNMEFNFFNVSDGGESWYNIIIPYLYESRGNSDEFSYQLETYPPGTTSYQVMGNGFGPLQTVSTQTTDIDPIIIFVNNDFSINEPKPIFSINGTTTYINPVGYLFVKNSNANVYVYYNETLRSSIGSNDIYIIEKFLVFNYIFVESHILLTPKGNLILTQFINVSKYDLSVYTYEIYDKGLLKETFPFGFEDGSNLKGFSLSISFLLPNETSKTRRFSIQPFNYFFNIPSPISVIKQPTLYSVDVIHLFEFKYLFQIQIDKTLMLKCFIINNKEYGHERLVAQSTSMDTFISTDYYTYEIVIDTFLHYPEIITYEDIYGYTQDFKIGEITSPKSLKRIPYPPKLQDVDIFSISDLSYLHQVVDITNKTVSNIIYFNFTKPIEKERVIGFQLLDRVSLNQIENDGIGKVYYSKWNSTIKLFQVEFEIPSNTQSGVIPWKLVFGGWSYIKDIVDGNLATLFSSYLSKSVQLTCISKNYDGYGPVINNLSVISTSLEVGLKINIYDPINGFKNGTIKISGELDSSTYIFYLEPTGQNYKRQLLRNEINVKLSSGDDKSGFYQLWIPIPLSCVPQNYSITYVELYDTQMNRAIFSENGNVVEPIQNPFINFMDFNNRIVPNFCSNTGGNTVPFLTDFQMYEFPNGVFNFNFTVTDLDSGIRIDQTPIIYISTLFFDSIKCYSKLFSQSSINTCRYTCSINVPYGFGFRSEFIFSVYGFINNLGYYSGYSSHTLGSNGWTNRYNGLIIDFMPDTMTITDTSTINEKGGLLWVLGSNFYKDFIDPNGNMYSSFVVYINYTETLNKYEQPPITVYSSAFSVMVNATTKPFIIYIMEFDMSGNLISISNKFTVVPKIFNISYDLPPTPTPTTPLPTNPPQLCFGEPICGGKNQGYCLTNVGCVCYSPWIGNDCSSQVIIIPQPKPNPNDPTTEIIITPNSTSTSNIQDYSFKSIVSLIGIREIDFNSKVVNEYYFEKWNLTKINNETNLYQTSIIVPPTTIDGISTTTTYINTTLQWFTKETNISFANQSLIMNPSTIKYTISFSNYNFKNQLNQLELIMSASLLSSKTNDICSGNEFGETNSIDNSNYLKIKVGDHSLYGRFIKRALIDGLPKSISNTILEKSEFNSLKTIDTTPHSDQLFIAISIPQYKEYVIIDPDFSLLIDHSKNSNSNNICTYSKSGLSSGQLAGIIIGSVAFVAVISISLAYHFVKKNNNKKLLNNIKNKLKVLN
ncbi:EGF-like domain-containing protein [Dictyostelium discoideum AX4]|uniref:EGF-like domain-containing protein n=1 Tax=Dictyostelium discoideum TaxID=44689 RepID=Q54L67_DICDI|nr:EGF-like domain-containing protein [Dictyostelium discoideum AX4]EAL63991.2 EGF-like domain-containing protein [Dictyostelium discoideum AX4]|eukprot:XP_637496.2 EGF-like domain-containing protein [Dictyostelium discoideum AX4]